MQVELSKDDLGVLMAWYHDAFQVQSMLPHEVDLYGKILELYRSAEELEVIDLNDCGDACRL